MAGGWDAQRVSEGALCPFTAIVLTDDGTHVNSRQKRRYRQKHSTADQRIRALLSSLVKWPRGERLGGRRRPLEHPISATTLAKAVGCGCRSVVTSLLDTTRRSGSGPRIPPPDDREMVWEGSAAVRFRRRRRCSWLGKIRYCAAFCLASAMMWGKGVVQLQRSPD